MPYLAVTLRPGIDVESTPTALQAGFSTSNLIRFRAGFVEKIGGWVKFYFAALAGVPRALQAWLDLNGNTWLGVGTTQALDVINSGNLTTITPQTLTSDFSPNFSTTMSSALVSIVDPNISNVTTYDSIYFNTPISIGGLILSGAYSITTILSPTSYQITAASNAASSVSNAGAVPSFTTTNGSSTVSVTLAAHGLVAGNSIVFPIATSVGGLTIQGTYSAVSITSSSVFTISATATASSGATVSMNSGNAELVYYIAIGPVAAGTGYSFSTYSSGTYSGIGGAGSSQTGTAITATDWTMDNWGSTLLSCPANGGIYAWTPNAGIQNAQLIPAAPIFNSGIVVATPAQILIGYGSTVKKVIGVAQDPLTYVWSDQKDYTYWTAGTTNPNTGLASQAGNNRIPTGSAIKAAIAAPQQVLMWTDLDLWAITYIGNVSAGLIFGQTKIGSNCGAVSRHAVAQMRGGVFWMGTNNFFVMAGGAPTVLPCTVWDVVYQQLDTNNLDKCFAVPISSFDEIMFFFPSTSGGGQADMYAKFNLVQQVWDYGSLQRSAGIGQSVLGNPLLGTSTGIIYQHDQGYNADGAPLVPSFSTGFFYLSDDGESFVFVDWVLPDWHFTTNNGSTPPASIQLSFNVITYMGQSPVVYGPFTMTSTTPYLAVRFRGRQASITVTSNDVGTYWRMGKVRLRWAPAGRR